MRILADLGFLDIAEGPNGLISYVLIYDPYQVVKKHYEAGNINAATYNALKQRMIEIGADDLDEVETTVGGKAPPKKSEGKRRRAATGIRAG